MAWFSQKEARALAMALIRGHQSEPLEQGEMERKVEELEAWALRSRISHALLELLLEERIEARIEPGEENPRFGPRLDVPSDESIAAVLREWQKKDDKPE